MKHKDCYYYTEDHDFHVTIPCCVREVDYGSCPCEDCDRYIPSDAVYDYVEGHFNEIIGGS